MPAPRRSSAWPGSAAWPWSPRAPAAPARPRRVDSPPSVRRASATCASSARDGWQQVKTSRSRSSRTTSGGSASTGAPPPRPPCRPAAPRAAGGRWPAVGGDQQPGPRVVRHAVARPGLQRADHGVLDGVLGQVQAAGDADQRGQHAGALLAYQPRERVPGRVRLIATDRSR